MGFIEVLPAIGGMLYVTTLTVVGVRLLVLAARNRARPELYLGGALLIGTVAASIEGGGLALEPEVGPAVAGTMLMVGKLCGLVAGVLHLSFVRQVFRPAERWAGWLVVGLLSLSAAAFLGFASHGTFSTAEIPSRLFALEFIGRTGGSCWMAAEAVRYHGMMKRRLALGMADPIVTDRFRLWAGAALSSVVMLMASVPPVFLPPTEVLLLSLDAALLGLAGLAASAFYSLAFFPPATYRRRLMTAAPAA